MMYAFLLDMIVEKLEGQTDSNGELVPHWKRLSLRNGKKVLIKENKVPKRL